MQLHGSLALESGMRSGRLTGSVGVRWRGRVARAVIVAIDVSDIRILARYVASPAPIDGRQASIRARVGGYDVILQRTQPQAR